MAPALRMTRSIKEKLPFFWRNFWPWVLLCSSPARLSGTKRRVFWSLFASSAAHQKPGKELTLLARLFEQSCQRHQDHLVHIIPLHEDVGFWLSLQALPSSLIHAIWSPNYSTLTLYFIHFCFVDSFMSTRAVSSAVAIHALLPSFTSQTQPLLPLETRCIF
jgi:hypothetical protein